MRGDNKTGKLGESYAAKYLSQKGYEILKTNYRTPFAEIDIVAKDTDGTICFVEVKTRKSSDFAQGREFVDYHKQRRIRTTAAYYLAQRQTEKAVRFDVIEIYAPEGTDTKNPIINHLEDAFL